jgi:hypothetical protein
MITLTENKPTEPGYYVICDDRDDVPEVVEVEYAGGELWYSYHNKAMCGIVWNSMAHWSERIDMEEP